MFVVILDKLIQISTEYLKVCIYTKINENNQKNRDKIWNKCDRCIVPKRRMIRFVIGGKAREYYFYFIL